MSVAPEQSQMTLEELLASDARGRFELVDGQLEEVHVSNLSTEVEAKIFWMVRGHCEQKDLGKVLGSGSYYQMFADNPRKARKPDLSFISKHRLPNDWLEQDYFTLAPDMAAEVVSQNDTSNEIDEKIEEYLSAGVRLVWQINPMQRLVIVHRLDGTVTKLHVDDTLRGEDVIPGFECKVADLMP